MSHDHDDILIRREGAAGRITMNRPKALNALTYPMVGDIAWHSAMAQRCGGRIGHSRGAGDRALCAGGDVLSLYESRIDGSGFARRFWADEYRLNAQIARYSKPFVA